MLYDFILFDADGTLFDFDRSERYSFTALCSTFGIPFSETLYSDYHVINDGLWKDHERGLIEKPKLLVERYDRLIKKHGINADPAALNSFYLHTLGGCCYLLEGAEEICEFLSRTKSLYLVTNGETTVQNNRYNSSPIKKYFRDIFISAAVGCPKPNREYFDYVADHIPGYSADRAIIVGDSLTSDIRGGNNAEIDACWFNPKGTPNDRGVKVDYEIRSLDELKKIIAP